MAKVVWGMIMSVDGFVNDRHGSLGKLYASFEPNEEINAAMGNIGAVVMGRNSFEGTEDTDAYADNYEFQVPLYILTHHPPPRHPKENANLTIKFVTDGIENAIRQAKASAGDKDVVVLGASTGQQALKAGLVDAYSHSIEPPVPHFRTTTDKK